MIAIHEFNYQCVFFFGLFLSSQISKYQFLEFRLTYLLI